MAKKKTPLELGRRERQIVETVVKLGEAAVSDVLANLVDPPSYSSVRSMLGLLVEKKWLKFRQDGKRYLYRPASAKEKVQKTAVKRLLDTFFGGDPSEAFAALLDSASSQLDDQEYDRLMDLVRKAKEEK